MTIYVEALAGLCALSALLALLYGPWQELCTDYARQILFEKRDALFDLALAGTLNFEAEEYRSLRKSMEQLIRFAHEVTLARILFLMVALRWRGVQMPSSPLAPMFGRIQDEEIRQQVSRLFGQAHLTVVAMIVFKSPMLLVLLAIASPLVTLGILAAVMLGLIRRWWAAVEHGAQIVGATVQVEAAMAPDCAA